MVLSLKIVTISLLFCHDWMCVALNISGVAILRSYCNALFDGGEGTAMLQPIACVANRLYILQRFS